MGEELFSILSTSCGETQDCQREMIVSEVKSCHLIGLWVYVKIVAWGNMRQYCVMLVPHKTNKDHRDELGSQGCFSH